MIETIFVAVIIIGSISTVYYTIRCFLRKNFIKAYLTLPIATLLIVILFLSGAVIFEQSTYQRLTREHAVAIVEFEQIAQREFRMFLTPSHHPSIETTVHGDQWQIDARIIKWKGVAAKLGLQPLYKLERISGRYSDSYRETSDKRTIFELKNNDLSLWNLLIEYQSLLPWLDSYYGNATYIPMAHKARFAIALTSSGLIARPRNYEASQSLSNWLAGS